MVFLTSGFSKTADDSVACDKYRSSASRIDSKSLVLLLADWCREGRVGANAVAVGVKVSARIKARSRSTFVENIFVIILNRAEELVNGLTGRV